ncbi:innexin inx1-like [Galendromus occidentalis]|uniref:Innexin n=1 Tax=Galendromus occidentalis TaxID=34638 RepID=A0AAJ6QXM3_9ACAR|nr:innexin inx1-like [Galendromus occidentalis]
MIGIFDGIHRIFRHRKKGAIVENGVFRLHWQFTAGLLLFLAVIVSARQYIGTPIECIPPEKVPAIVANSYCWIHPTFTLPDAHHKRIGSEIAAPGIDNSAFYGRKKHVAYYQWVYLTLIVQAVVFYLPHYVWKNWEGGLMGALTSGPAKSDDERRKKRETITLWVDRNFGKRNLYTYKYLFCEMLCFLNVLMQMFLMDTFLGGEFMNYGIKVLEFLNQDDEDRMDPMRFVFPRMTKCIFRRFGPSGDVMKEDILCVLPQNVFNEKLYVLAWFWFVFLLTVLSGLIVYRFLILMLPSMRERLLMNRCHLGDPDDVRLVVKSTNIADWFFLYMMGPNLDSLLYAELIGEIAATPKLNSNRNGTRIQLNITEKTSLSASAPV